MELHIIHLPHRTDRMQILLQEMAQQNISDYRIWKGVTNVVPSRGIAKGHQQIISYAKECNLPSVIIAEDDIHFSAPGGFDFFVRNQPRVFDLYLGGILWRDNQDDQDLTDFFGLTLYMIQERFYETILTLTGHTGIDRELAGKGDYKLCRPLVATQHNGFSDNKKSDLNFDRYNKSMHYYGSEITGSQNFSFRS